MDDDQVSNGFNSGKNFLQILGLQPRTSKVFLDVTKEYLVGGVIKYLGKKK